MFDCSSLRDRRPRWPLLCLLLAPSLAALAIAGTAQAAEAAPSGPARLTEMGRFFEQSEPPSQDLAKARDLYCRAAAAGHPEALQRLGWLYYKGNGVSANPQIAGTMFRWAADLGDARAAGLSGALPMTVEAAPPCLVTLGVASLTSLRTRREAEVARALPTPVVENPVQFDAVPASADRQRIARMVVEEARQFRLDPRLVLAVMRAESNFDPLAKSPRGAQGLMQLIPETAQRFKVQNPFDPQENMRGGMAYLRWLLAYYRGDVPLTLAAYNAGEGAVDRFRGVPPYAETIAYVQRIRALYPFDRHPFDQKTLAAGQRSWIDRDVAATLR